jgi:hypothetical protein
MGDGQERTRAYVPVNDVPSFASLITLHLSSINEEIRYEVFVARCHGVLIQFRDAGFA